MTAHGTPILTTFAMARNSLLNVKPIASIHDHASTTVKLLLTRTGAQRTPSTLFPSVSRTSKTHKMNLLAPDDPPFYTINRSVTKTPLNDSTTVNITPTVFVTERFIV